MRHASDFIGVDFTAVRRAKIGQAIQEACIKAEAARRKVLAGFLSVFVPGLLLMWITGVL
jgi:hypothetical protein